LIGSAASPSQPLLGPLVANGGPTLTMALFPGSPAVAAGDISLGNTFAVSACSAVQRLMFVALNVK